MQDQSMNLFLGTAVVLPAIFLIGLYFILYTFYLKNLSDSLKQVHEERKTIKESRVWLMFIPIFNLIYPFILYPKVAQSLKYEFDHRGLTVKDDFGKTIGVGMSIILIVNMILQISKIWNPIQQILSLAFLVLFIVYWVKISGYKKVLKVN